MSLSEVKYAVVALAAFAGLAATPAGADEFEGFRSPTSNIHCMYYAGDEGTFLRCDVLEMSNTPPAAPAECDVDWGDAFEMSSAATHAETICHGDTVSNPDGMVLDYGESWQKAGFTCKSEKTGMSCRNEQGAGWDLSRAKQKLY